MAVIDEVTAYLIAESVVTAMGTDLFTGVLPDDPDAALLVNETGGSPGEKGFGVTGLQYENPSFQFLARGVADDYDTARALCKSAQTAMAKIGPKTLSGTIYLHATVLQEPTFIGQDALRRPRFTCNVVIQKEP